MSWLDGCIRPTHRRIWACGDVSSWGLARWSSSSLYSEALRSMGALRTWMLRDLHRRRWPVISVRTILDTVYYKKTHSAYVRMLTGFSAPS